MIRLLLQYLISRRLDDGRPLGTLLSRWVRDDEPTRRFYEDSLKLGSRLRNDASRLLERSAFDHRSRPLAIVSRAVIQPRRQRRTAITAALFFLCLMGSGVFFGWRGAAIVAQTPNADRLDVETIQNDPKILGELAALCRDVPNERGPFFKTP